MSSSAKTLRKSLLKVEANDDFTEAVMHLHDSSKLCFCHRVGQRWAKAIGQQNRDDQAGSAHELLSAMKTFRLNAKHLDIQFADGSRWDEAVTSLNLSSSDNPIDEPDL